jgi:hypothetical protein
MAHSRAGAWLAFAPAAIRFASLNLNDERIPRAAIAFGDGSFARGSLACVCPGSDPVRLSEPE